MGLYPTNRLEMPCGNTSQQSAKKQKMKNLLAIGTLPSEQGKGVGSKLVAGALVELEAEQYYGGYWVESSNPRNVTFYEKNGFQRLDTANIVGCTLTYLVRPDLHKPTTSVEEAAAKPP